MELRADYLVEQNGQLLVAEVKTGDEAPNLETAATRRQLLEYYVAFAADGVLLVCPERGAIHRIVFPGRLPLADSGRARLVSARCPDLAVWGSSRWLSLRVATTSRAARSRSRTYRSRPPRTPRRWACSTCAIRPTGRSRSRWPDPSTARSCATASSSRTRRRPTTTAR